MDLIFMNASREDIGVLQDYELDLAFGADENNFECRIQSQAHCCEAGFFLYAEGTEYGGVIDSITSDTAKKEVIYSGRTWQGVLNSKIIEPDEGADYLIVSGDANEVLHSLVERLALSDMFDSATEDSGIEVSNYKMHRYVSGYDGIRKMLASVGGKLKFKFKDGRVVLSALPVHDYSRDEEFDADLVSFKAVRNYKSVNHLICLGAGELADRLVVHLYADTEGNISQTQTQTGMDEVGAIYEYNNIDNEEELISEGTAKFKEILSADEISIDFDSNDDKYDVGDIIGAYDPITHLFATASIEKKIVTIKDGRITISLSPDKAKGGISMEIGGASIGGGGGGGIDIELPVSIENGGTGVTTLGEMIQTVFTNGNAAVASTYPTTGGFYCTTGTNIFANLTQTHSNYGVLVIFRAFIYQLHIYVDLDQKMFYGWSSNSAGTIKEPTAWQQVDGIVEQGTSGIWTYRKYQSGIAECWGTQDYTGTSDTAWGSLYRMTCTAPTYPFTFKEIPSANLDIVSTSGSSYWISSWSGGNASSLGTFALVRPVAGGTVGVKVSFYARGKWK